MAHFNKKSNQMTFREIESIIETYCFLDKKFLLKAQIVHEVTSLDRIGHLSEEEIEMLCNRILEKVIPNASSIYDLIDIHDLCLRMNKLVEKGRFKSLMDWGCLNKAYSDHIFCRNLYRQIQSIKR